MHPTADRWCRFVTRSSHRRVKVTIGALLAACSPGGSEHPDGPYRGSRIEVIVPFREGGGTDMWTRAIAPHLQRALGNEVSVRVVNVLGASGVQGGNQFALSRRHDGLTLFVSSGSNVLPWLFGEPAVRYDFPDFAGILGAPTGGVVYLAAAVGIADAEGFCQASDLVYGGISPTGLDIVPLVSFELLGLEVDAILGYQGKGAARLAFERGETNLDYQTSSAYLTNVMPLVESGEAVPLYSFGTVDDAGRVTRDPVFPDLPSIAEVYELCRGEPAGGPGWDAYRSVLAAGFAAQKNLWVHADAPPARIRALRDAAARMVADSAFGTSLQELIGGYPLHVGEVAERHFEAAATMTPEARRWLLDLMRRKYGVGI